MKIVVLSDTHIPIFTKKVSDKIYREIEDCDLVIHAGDIVDASFLTELESLAEVKAVKGNMDSYEIKQKLPEKLVIDAAGKKIGVIHGYGPGVKVQEVARQAFNKKVNIIIFGHSHTAVNKVVDGVLFFNPGSATDNITSRSCSFGVIKIEGDEIKSEIIECGQ